MLVHIQASQRDQHGIRTYRTAKQRAPLGFDCQVAYARALCGASVDNKLLMRKIRCRAVSCPECLKFNKQLNIQKGPKNIPKPTKRTKPLHRLDPRNKK